MKRWIAVTAAVGIAVGGLSARAAEKRVEEITCEEFLTMKPESQDRIAYWVDGYAEAKNQGSSHTVAFDKFGQPLDVLVTACEASPRETLWEQVKKHL
jgi:hypothetical protein